MGNAAATFDLRRSRRHSQRRSHPHRRDSLVRSGAIAAATAADLFGGYWDISWHISIGRDTSGLRAHDDYLAGVLAGIASGYAILTTTFGSSPGVQDASVSVLGFRGPLGCFMAAVGGFAMLTSAAVRQLVA